MDQNYVSNTSLIIIIQGYINISYLIILVNLIYISSYGTLDITSEKTNKMIIGENLFIV